MINQEKEILNIVGAIIVNYYLLDGKFNTVWMKVWNKHITGQWMEMMKNGYDEFLFR